MILDTDYKTFAAVFSCDDLWFNVERYINAWVITRERDHYKAKEAVSIHTEWMEWMSHRMRKETKQQSGMLPGPAVPGCCSVSFHILLAILSSSTVVDMTLDAPKINATFEG